jgi:hypothetical protein
VIAGELLVAIVAALAAFYQLVVRGRFKGPRLDLSALEREK